MSKYPVALQRYVDTDVLEERDLHAAAAFIEVAQRSGEGEVPAEPRRQQRGHHGGECHAEIAEDAVDADRPADPLAGLRAALAPVSGPRNDPDSPSSPTYLGAVL